MLNFFGKAFWQTKTVGFVFKNYSDIVLCGAPRDLNNYAILFFAKLLKKRIFWWGHYEGANSSKYRNIVKRIILSTVEGVAFYTDEEVRRYKKDALWPKKNVIGLGNGLDSKSISALRSTAPLSKNKNILFIGS